MSIAEKLQTIAENEQRVFDAGKKAEYDAFWDAFQKGERLHYNTAFAYTGWNDKNYNPKYPITARDNNNGIGNMFFWNQGITDTKVPITAMGNAGQAFSNAKNMKRIPKLIFNGCTNVTNMFLGCYNLEELYCEGTLDITGLNLQWSTKLSKASIESIINALSTTTSGLTVTLSQEAVNNAFTADEWSALEATRRNWTISLV